MESSIARFLKRQVARELLPTNVSEMMSRVSAALLRYFLVSLHVDKIAIHLCAIPVHRVPVATEKHFQYLLAYLLGLLAMIKCSICSYQCDN